MQRVTHVLLVDDDEASNFLTKILLEKLGAAEKIEVVLNGQQALTYMQTQGVTPACPDLILLDINMPIMNGFEFLEHLGEVSLSKTPRIVLLTSSISPRDADQARSFRVEMINKPVTLDKLKALFQ
jgi:CheY-like chemotaxis protein